MCYIRQLPRYKLFGYGLFQKEIIEWIEARGPNIILTTPLLQDQTSIRKQSTPISSQLTQSISQLALPPSQEEAGAKSWIKWLILAPSSNCCKCYQYCCASWSCVAWIFPQKLFADLGIPSYDRYQAWAVTVPGFLESKAFNIKNAFSIYGIRCMHNGKEKHTQL